MKQNKKMLSTYEKLMKKIGKEGRKKYQEELKEFLLSELLLAIMEEDEISVRLLAKKAGVSSTVVQEIRSGKKHNPNLQTVLKIANSLGYRMVFEKGDNRFSLELPR
jgi:DNA-binding phage protein